MVGGEGNVGVASERIFGKFGSGGDSVEVTGTSSQIPVCPKCGVKTQRVCRAGTYQSLLGDVVQRWLCRRCGLRFSDPDDAALANKHLDEEFSFGTTTLKSDEVVSGSCQICEMDAKNLVAEQTTTIIVLRKNNFDVNTLLAKYEWYLKKEGYRLATIVSRTRLLKTLLKRGADFDDPEDVKLLIAKQPWCEGRKGNAVDAYSSYMAMEGKTWNRPIYNGIAKIPFVPKETEIDQLIAGCTPRVATFLQLLKETHARPGEIWHCTEDNFDFETNTVTIVPEKGSNPRIFNMSPKLLGMLHNLPKEYGKCTFALLEMKLDYFRTSYEKQRNRLATKLNNPRLKKIMFKTLRTWGGTMDYHKTKDPLYVMKRLGHKNLKNTLIYIQLEEALFKDEIDYVSKVAKTEAEACVLIEAGFDFVCDFDGHKLFRKKKY
jgi:integrase